LLLEGIKSANTSDFKHGSHQPIIDHRVGIATMRKQSTMPREQRQQKYANGTGMKRQRSQHRHREICWTTAFLVCLATLQSMNTIEYGESFVFVTPPSSPLKTSITNQHRDNALYDKNKARIPSIPTTSLGAKRKYDEPWSITANSNGAVGTKQKPHADTEQVARKPSSIDDMSVQLQNHDLLTREEEYELGVKIREFIDTKKEIDEIVERKRAEQKKLENERRRGNQSEDRKLRLELAKRMASHGMRQEEFQLEDDGNDFAMEDELEEFLINKGLSSKKLPSPSGFRNSVEDLYGSYEDEEDEEAMMEELGMAVYGIDTYNEDYGFSDDLAIVDSPQNNDYDCEFTDDIGISSIPEFPSSSQLSDTLDDIRSLTDREITEDLGIEGGRKELAQVMIRGAIAKQQMIKSNVRLVSSIVGKWMSRSKGSGLAVKHNDVENLKLSKTDKMGDWSTPSMDEAIQQGIVGLAIAAERFEPDRKFKFSTYATYYITNEVRKTFQSATTQCLYVPPYFYTIKNKYQKIVREHYRKTAGDPNQVLSMEKIAGMLELKLERLQFILKSTQSLVQLDACYGSGLTSPGKAGGNDNTANDPIVNSLASDDLSPEAVVERSLLRQCLENALAVELLPLERDVVRLRHGLDDGKSRTVREVSESCGGMLSIKDVRSLESRAYKKLRFKHSVHNARLREFAEEFIGVNPEMLKTA